jgi:hypothetical protein
MVLAESKVLVLVVGWENRPSPLGTLEPLDVLPVQAGEFAVAGLTI